MLKKIISSIVLGGATVGIILSGWGFDNISGFFKHPARAIMLISMVAVIVGTVLFAEKFQVSFARKGKRQNYKELITGLVLPTLILILILFVLPYSDRHNFLVFAEGNILRYSGLIIYIIGFILAIWAPIHMGKEFSVRLTIQEKHKLVTDGPFTYIRHPRYSGGIQWMFGVALIFRSIIGLAGAVLMAILFIWRIQKEEKMMRQEFGGEWEEYSKRTKKMIPYIY